MATPTRIAAETLANRLREENECAHPSEMAVALAEDPSLLEDWLERAMVLGADERDARFQELRGLARTVVDGMCFQVPQSGTCEHQWCVAVRRLRALVGGEGK